VCDGGENVSDGGDSGIDDDGDGIERRKKGRV
jgi:hypothetical protein